jgi:hypothetical protein
MLWAYAVRVATLRLGKPLVQRWMVPAEPEWREGCARTAPLRAQILAQD